jgi:hypothetical protein
MGSFLQRREVHGFSYRRRCGRPQYKEQFFIFAL